MRRGRAKVCRVLRSVGRVAEAGPLCFASRIRAGCIRASGRHGGRGQRLGGTRRKVNVFIEIARQRTPSIARVPLLYPATCYACLPFWARTRPQPSMRLDSERARSSTMRQLRTAKIDQAAEMVSSFCGGTMGAALRPDNLQCKHVGLWSLSGVES